MENKKASHVGIMISFAIFVTFLIFLIVILDPKIDIADNKQKLLDSLETKIADNISSNAYVDNSLLSSLISLYNSDYEKLKQKIGVQSNSDFWFGLQDSSRTNLQAPTEDIPETVEVYSGEISVGYYSGDENIKYGFLLVKVW